jgi:hypothetical protein
MKKEELIHLHLLLAQLKKYCEEQGLDCDFTRYQELGISPIEIHRSKEEHKQAIFVLATDLASMAATRPIGGTDMKRDSHKGHAPKATALSG